MIFLRKMAQNRAVCLSARVNGAFSHITPSDTALSCAIVKQ